MNQAPADAVAMRSRLSVSKLKDWLKKGRHWLYGYRPRFRSWHFWAVQGLVIGIAAIHDIIEVGGYLPRLGMLYFIPISLFFVPVVYAALNFGFAGSIATALWATIITIPNFILWHHGLEKLGVMFQMVIVVTVAVFVGQRVDRETGARRRAEAAGDALRASETRYRGLFESSPIAILVLEKNGTILDANPAAGALFGKDTETLKSMVVADLVGTESGQKLLASSYKDKWQEAPLTLRLRDGSDANLEPTGTQVSDSQGNTTIQVLLRDVTQERHRQAGLRAYAAYVLRAQEEERQRIARELHDETIQTLALLCRQLGGVESTSGSLPSSTIEELREARKIAEEVVTGLRDFARALRPPTLDDLGIVTSIRRLLMDSTERTGIKGQLKLVGEERRLPRDTELGMFRIAQEALWNVERHSRATEVIVTMTFAEYEVRLDVQDNGVGFNVPPMPEGFSASGQLGLLGMQERAELLGGKLEVQSSPQKGATVIVSIPIPEAISEAPDQYLVL
jgi:PAS domain S-box-containing protein